MRKKSNKINLLSIAGWLLLFVVLIILIMRISSGGIYIVVLSAITLILFWIDRLNNKNIYSLIGQYLSLVSLVVTLILFAVYFL